jgi:hypothetical protein
MRIAHHPQTKGEKMKVVKITNDRGVFYTDKVNENKHRPDAEVIEMSKEEYHLIPATQSAFDFFSGRLNTIGTHSREDMGKEE